MDDPDIVPGLQWTLDNDITDVLDQTFTVSREVEPSMTAGGDADDDNNPTGVKRRPKPPPGAPGGGGGAAATTEAGSTFEEAELITEGARTKVCGRSSVFAALSVAARLHPAPSIATRLLVLARTSLP